MHDHLVLGQDGSGIKITGYNVEIKAVRHIQIIDDGKDIGKQLYYRNKVNGEKEGQST